MDIDSLVNTILKDLLYIVFGSPSSTDLDVVVWIPNDMITLTKYHKIICSKLDNILPTIAKSDKKANTCLAHWDLISPNILIWCQKGSLAESWNGYLITQHFHSQMYDTCPINTCMVRTKEDIIFNILSATRRMLASMTHSIFIDESEKNLKILLSSVMKLPQVRNLNLVLRNRFVTNIFRIWDVQTTNFSTIGNLAITQRDLRKKFSKIFKLLQNDETTNDHVLKQYWKVYDESKEFVQNTMKNFELKSISSINACEFSIKSIVSAIHKMRYIGLQIDFLKLIDFMNIKIPLESISPEGDIKIPLESISPSGDIKIIVEEVDNWKTFAFQLGQKFLLTKNIEVFTKEDVALHFPYLKPFLFRQELNQVDKRVFSSLLLQYLNDIQSFVSPDMCEIIY